MNDKTRNRVWKWSLIGLFGMAALALPAGGYWLYRHQTQAIRSEKQSELKVIAELKAGQIATWRSERLADVRVNSKMTGLRATVGHWLQGSGDTSSSSAIHEDMELLRKSYGYENVILAATDGRILLSLDSHLSVLDARAKGLVAQAVSSRDAVFGDLFRCPSGNDVYLDAAAPILAPDNRAVAVLIVRTDAEQFLYPFAQSWPTLSRSAETLLVRRDGDDVLFLNKLRHRPNPALTLRIPLARVDVPAVQAALGKTGAIEGWDNRGVKVLAEILPVPGSPWLMVAKVDVDEIFAEARYRGRFILLFTALSMLVTGAMAALVFSYRQKTLYQNLYRAEHQRQQVEGEIRATFYSIGDGVISTDAAGRVTRMNPVAEKLTGWSEAEALGKLSEQVFRIVNEETRAAVESPVARVMRDGIVVNLANHTLLIARDGTERPIADSGAPIRNEQGQVAGVVLVFRDQTDDRRAEEALRETKDYLENLIRFANAPIIVWNTELQITEFNRAFEALTGMTRDTVIGKHLDILFPSESREALMNLIRDTLSGARWDVVDIPIRHISGETRTVLWNSANIVSPDGDIIATIAQGQDITERKRAEEAMRRSEEQYRCLVENVDAGITLIDANHTIVTVNSAQARSFRKAVSDFPGRKCYREFEKRDAICPHCPAVKAMATGLPAEVETEGVRDDGSHFAVRLKTFPVFGPDGIATGFIELIDDITQFRQAEESLRQARITADCANQAKSEFLANMSHEIRTPMTAILGFTDLLMDHSLSAADCKTYLTTVRRNGEHLLQLINDILDLSKIEAGKMVVELGPCHLPSTVADVASMMRPRAEEHGSTLEVRYTGPLPETIHTDGARLRQVIVNLVGNAVKFTENGSIRIGASFLPQWRPDQSAVSLEVTDTGIGICEESLSRLFEPFTQAENSTTRKYGGTGLGLAISRQIVTALGGELTVRSTAGAGSTFTVTIPTGDISGVNLLQSPGEGICEDEAGTRWNLSTDALGGVKILLAEDSADNQELLCTVLGMVGAELEVVENGKLAVERAEMGTFDVVLMDMNMPEMDGYEATRRLRDRGYGRPILALTANAMTGDSERCLAAGCDAHLAKPIDRRQLIETVAQFAMSRASQTDAPAAAILKGTVPFSRDPSGARNLDSLLVIPSPVLGQSDGIASQFADDPQLADILPGFVERLPSQLDALCKALEEDRLEDAERIAHRLKGAGGSYGYPTLSDVAKSLELAAKAHDMDGATAALADVKEACAAIQTGCTSQPRETGQP